jgi:phage-related protein
MEIIFWNDKIEKFILSLDSITRPRVINVINLLEEYGNLLGMSDSKSLGKGLFELRTQGKVRVRIIYIFHNSKAYIIHGFIKKAWKISLKDIAIAKRIQKDINRS